MKSQTTVAILAIVGAFAVGFWLYGVGRTMRETVNFHASASISGLFLGVALPLAVLAPLLIAMKLWLREKPWPVSYLVVAFAASLLVGSFASECWILRDEARFSAEAANAGSNPYSRTRAWPNQTCGLVFEPGKGIHSTD